MKATKKKTTFASLYEELDTAHHESRSLFALMQELRAGLQLYYQKAEAILAGSGIRVIPVTEDCFSLERNFFSTLFLYSYFREAISSPRRVMYVAINQCLRGMVTGCDNVLDNEYKMTLDTDLPEKATRFRSILDIMVSDRVLFEILTDLCRTQQISFDVLKAASAASLTSLARSGAQEASEEAGVQHALTPEDVLLKVHHFKTGLLFQCTWALPAIIEGGTQSATWAMKTALYRIGMGCQVLDDLVDLFSDIRMKRHNYVAALAFQRLGAAEWKRLQTLAIDGDTNGTVARFYRDYPAIRESAYVKALAFLKTGLQGLFAEEHASLVEPAIRFICGRIGVDRVFEKVRPSP